MVSALMKAELAATFSTLGRTNTAGHYVVDPQCFESVRDLIRFIRRDDTNHAVRLYLGSAKILQNDLVPIVTVSAKSDQLFDIAIRLLVNLTSPVILLYKEEIPEGKVGRNIYMQLISHSQDYKYAFCDVDFWKAVMAKLTQLFEVDWSERSEDSSLHIERLLVLLRNVLQVPADTELEHRPDNDITVHDKVLWALRESQLLELLLYVSSNKDEERYFLHLLEIFSLLLREQNPTSIAQCDIGGSIAEKNRDAQELASLRENEKYSAKNFKNTRNFHSTFVLKNVKTIANNDVVYHKSLDKLNDLKLTQDKKRLKIGKNKFPEDSDRPERRSTFSVRLFLKEFCMELLSCSFNHLMGTVKAKLLSGKGLANDESYYFWALKFFLEFSCAANVDVKLISECINVQTFHFVQTQIDNCYDNLQTDKKKFNIWVRRLHLNLKAYRSLLLTLVWMDSSKQPGVPAMSKLLKSNLFYVPEYRELMISCLLKYDSGKFPLSFLRDLIETNHINIKLIEHFCKSSKIVVQKIKRGVKKPKKKKKALMTVEAVPPVESAELVWERQKDAVYDVVEKGANIPEISPFDAASSVPIDDQKEDAMKNIQRTLRKGNVNEAVGLLRSARQVWPENDCFGSVGMAIEEEVMALQEICMADLGVVYKESLPPAVEEEEEEDDDEDSDDHCDRTETIEQHYNIEDYLKKLVNKKVVEGACILIANYKRNSANTNHAIIKLLHRIGWQCHAPAMMYQVSFFITLNKILHEKNPAYKEMQQFGKQLFKKFRENFAKNPKICMEMLFWKEPKIAIEIEEGYGTSEVKEMKGVWSEEEEDELRRLWVEFDENMLDGDKVDWIKNSMINQERSRISVIKKLKQLMLIMPGAKIVKSKKGGAEWSEDETALLTKLFHEHRTAMDVAEMIRDRMMARSKKSIKDRLVEIGLVHSLADLRKKKPRKGRSVVNNESEPGPNQSSDESEDEEVGVPSRFSPPEAIAALKKVESMKATLEWLKETFTDCIEDDDSSEGYPLLALDSTQLDALENEDFKEVLRALNISEPNEQQIYWKVRGNKIELNEVLELIKAAIDGKLDEIPMPDSVSSRRQNDSDVSDGEDEFEKLRRVLPKRSEENMKLDSSTHISYTDNYEKANGNASRNKTPRRSRIMGSDDSDEEVRVGQAEEPARLVDSDRSDRAEGSGEEMSPNKYKRKPTSLTKKKHRARLESGSDSDNNIGLTANNSDRSDKGGASGDDGPTWNSTNQRRAPMLSDSEGEGITNKDYWGQKRRRCIGSDSEIEGCASDEEMKNAPREIRKKSRMLDSDSEVESQGSV